MKAPRQLSTNVLILVVLSLILPTTVPPVHSQTTTKIVVNPPITTSLNLLPRHTLTLTINLTDSPAIDAFRVSVLTDDQVLNPLSITSGGFLGGGTVLNVLRCVNGAGMGCSIPTDGAGIVTFEEILLGSNSTRTSGALFTVNYNITGLGATQVHILNSILTLGGSIVSNVQTMDGYFANKDCPPGVFCRPPLVTFSVLANSNLVQGRPIVFNASFTTNNPGATLRSGFEWRFGDGTGQIFPNRTAIHVYTGAGNFLVVLRATDTDGATGFASTIVRIGRAPLYDLAVSLDSFPSGILVNGESVDMFVGVTNLSTQAENATVRITVQNTTLLTSRQFTNLGAFGGFASFNLTWSTIGLSLGTYQVEARVDPIKNSTTGQIIENATYNDFAAENFQIVPLPQQPIFVHNKIVFDHHLSLSRNPVETWNTTVENPDPRVSLFVEIVIRANSDGLPPAFLAFSQEFLLKPGETMAGITATSPTFPSSFIELRFTFTAFIYWGPSGQVPLISSSVRVGSFQIVP